MSYRKSLIAIFIGTVFSHSGAQTPDLSSEFSQVKTAEEALFQFDMRFTPEVQAENIKREERAKDKVIGEARRLGASFAGGWTEYDGNGHVSMVLGYTGSMPSRLSKSASNDVVQFRQQKYSQNYLLEVSQFIDAFAHDLYADEDGNPKGDEWGTVFFDPRKNKLDIAFPYDAHEKVIEFLDGKGVPRDAYDLEGPVSAVGTGIIQPAAGIIANDLSNSNSMGQCTMGYAANIAADNITYPALITAGHC